MAAAIALFGISTLGVYIVLLRPLRRTAPPPFSPPAKGG
jgi:hypothetical protein